MDPRMQNSRFHTGRSAEFDHRAVDVGAYSLFAAFEITGDSDRQHPPPETLQDRTFAWGKLASCYVTASLLSP